MTLVKAAEGREKGNICVLAEQKRLILERLDLPEMEIG
jgi:hypothetical protein|tara:strand:- start:560 stop:673 length:114 start_codon:yes stop_codon:yes gene_type:complete